MLDLNLRIEHLGWTVFSWNFLDRSWLLEFLGKRREIFDFLNFLFLLLFFNLLCALWCLNLVFGCSQRLNWRGLTLIKNKRCVSGLSTALCSHIVFIAEWESNPTIDSAIRNSWRHYINTIDWSCEIIFRYRASCAIWVKGLNNMLRVLLSQSC